MKNYLIRNATLVNEGKQQVSDVWIRSGRIEKIANYISIDQSAIEIDATGQFLFPGLIDDQVHFREPGLTHKADIYTESRAAVAGGITSFMEMPNTVPGAVTLELLEDKYQIAARKSWGNYSFFMGTTLNNLEELLKVDPKRICGIKIFMGSSTGNMLVDDETILDRIFSSSPTLIAVHCEDDPTIATALAQYKSQYGEDIPMHLHGLIRSREACYKSSSFAVALAKKHGTRLHVLHISTKEELALFDNSLALEQKKITSEACLHHLWFTDADYASKGSLIKWNPAVKTAEDRAALRKALTDGTIDVVATDHAPHTLEEKSKPYTSAPSGGPLVQQSLPVLYELVLQGVLEVTDISRLGAHHPAILFQIRDRGFIREGYHADLVLLDPRKSIEVTRENLAYKCGWSPFEGTVFQSAVSHTWVNGHLAYREGSWIEGKQGDRMEFDR